MNKLHNSKKELAEAKESPALGFIFNTEPVKSDITAVTNTMQQFDTGYQHWYSGPRKSYSRIDGKTKI